jgi:hypothetical protein
VSSNEPTAPEHDDPVEQWYKSLKRERSEWRDRWKQQRQQEQKQAAKTRKGT